MGVGYASVRVSLAGGAATRRSFEGSHGELGVVWGQNAHMTAADDELVVSSRRIGCARMTRNAFMAKEGECIFPLSSRRILVNTQNGSTRALN